MQSYSGGKPLPKPSKILVYEFEVNPEDVQVDKSQEIRLRHLIRGDEKPAKVGENASEELSKELVKALKKTGIPVERAAPGKTVPPDAFAIQGTFLSIKQGDKTERVAVGMGLGSAEIKTQVRARLQTPAEAVLVSEFETNTTVGENLGAAAPAAAGLNPAAAAGRATITDRKKNVSAYASKTADAAARQITSVMAGLGWIKLDDKGKVVQ